MDFEEQEEEMGNIPPPPGYESIPNNSSARSKLGAGVEGASTAARKPVRYRECLKNHAVGIGGHAVDGCGEFLPAGEEGTLDALKCAACNCHRNFHRKEADGCGVEGMHPFSSYYRSSQPPAGYLHLTPPGQHRPLALPAASGGHSREDEDMSNPTSSGGGGGSGSGSKNKRFRTRFTPDQKEKMLVFAERLGWRIQKHEEAAVEQFCAETGVRRQVLKVWMHNNKHTLGSMTSKQRIRDFSREGILIHVHPPNTTIEFRFGRTSHGQCNI